jgi:hypothetical protein
MFIFGVSTTGVTKEAKLREMELRRSAEGSGEDFTSTKRNKK